MKEFAFLKHKNREDWFIVQGGWYDSDQHTHFTGRVLGVSEGQPNHYHYDGEQVYTFGLTHWDVVAFYDDPQELITKHFGDIL